MPQLITSGAEERPKNLFPVTVPSPSFFIVNTLWDEGGGFLTKRAVQVLSESTSIPVEALVPEQLPDHRLNL